MSDTFLHAADLHLGARLISLGARVDEERAHLLRAEAAKAFADLIQIAVDERVAFIVIAGDLYDGAHRETRSQLEVLEAFELLHEHDIEVFVAHGNHDPVQGNYARVGALPPNVKVFPAGQVASYRVELPGGGEVAVSGISYRKAHEDERLVRLFTDGAPAGVAHIAVLHTNLGAVAAHGDYAPCNLDELRHAPVDYWALGHIHRRDIMELESGRWAVYPCNLQGRSHKPAETEPKGCLLVPLDGSAAGTIVGEPRFVPCDRVRFCRVDADVSAATDLVGVLDAATERCIGASEDQGGRPTLLHVTLSGRPQLHDNTKLRAETDVLLTQLHAQVAEHLHGGAVTEVVIATRPARDPAQLRARNDFVAAALNRVDELRAGAGGRELLTRALDGLAVRRGTADELERLLQDDAQITSLLDRVETLLLDELIR